MSEQIECVGGPRNGAFVAYHGTEYKVRKAGKVNLFLPVDDRPDPPKFKALDIFVYRYDSGKYIYQGVEQ